jgi:hypothetical protein
MTNRKSAMTPEQKVIAGILPGLAEKANALMVGRVLDEQTTDFRTFLVGHFLETAMKTRQNNMPDDKELGDILMASQLAATARHSDEPTVQEAIEAVKDMAKAIYGTVIDDSNPEDPQVEDLSNREQVTAMLSARLDLYTRTIENFKAGRFSIPKPSADATEAK